MDQDYANAVLQRWGEGSPVFEGTLYKAAEALGINPVAALLEARFYTALDRTLEKLAWIQSMPQGTRMGSLHPGDYNTIIAGAGFEQDGLEKTASQHQVYPLEIALMALENRGWVPNLQKLAFMAAGQGPESPPPGAEGDPAIGGGVDPAAMPPEMGPQPGQQVQQQPAARFRPTPTAPMQVPPSPEGNLDQILAEAQQAAQGQGGQGGQGAPGGPEGGPPQDPMAGAGEQPTAPPQPSPQDKLLSVAPNLDPTVIERYSQALEQLEQKVGMPVQDPKQLTKFIQQMQKADGKVIDEEIKNMADAQQQQMASPTLGAPKGLGAGGQGGAPGGAPPPQQPQPPAPAGPGAMAKVAHAAAALARSRYR